MNNYYSKILMNNKIYTESFFTIINPLTNSSTKFMVSGDPLTGTGRTEGEG